MGKTILITGKNTTLGNKIIEQYLSDHYQVIATIRDNADGIEPGEGVDKNLLVVPWKRRSPLSARNTILTGLNQFGSLDEAMMVFTHSGENHQLHETPAAVIESEIDLQIKSQLFMLKEVFSHFRKKGSGLLSLVIHSPSDRVLSPLDAVAAGAFRNLADSLFLCYQEENIRINGFDSTSNNLKDYAQFISATLRGKGRNSHGKWFRHGEKSLLTSIGFPFSGASAGR